MKIKMSATEVAIAMDALATRRQQIAQWVEDRKVDGNYSEGAIEEAEQKIKWIDKTWRVLNIADTKDMMEAREDFLSGKGGEK